MNQPITIGNLLFEISNLQVEKEINKDSKVIIDFDSEGLFINPLAIWISGDALVIGNKSFTVDDLKYEIDKLLIDGLVERKSKVYIDAVREMEEYQAGYVWYDDDSNLRIGSKLKSPLTVQTLLKGVNDLLKHKFITEKSLILLYNAGSDYLITANHVWGGNFNYKDSEFHIGG